MTAQWESVQDWIARQGWPESVETAALLMVQSRDEKRLNPLTLGQWRAWEKRQ